MISVIIPVYNGEKYIEKIIGCFERQIYNNFELVFVNDGSKDKSLKVLNRIKNNSNLKIIVITQQNSGVSKARNVGIENSKGEFICFCDVDDEVKENYISDMRLIMENNNVDLVICKHQWIKANEKETTFMKETGTGEVIIKNSVSCLRDFLYGRIKSGCWTTMTRKSIILNNDLHFMGGYMYSEDLHMLWRIIASSRNIAYLDKHLYIYKSHDNSTSAKFNENRLDGYKLMKNLELFFEKNVPEFSSEYKLYGASKLMWSIVWQAAIYYDYKKFKTFCIYNKVKNDMVKLLTFKKFYIQLSAFVFCVSLRMFRYFSILFGEKYTNFSKVLNDE